MAALVIRLAALAGAATLAACGSVSPSGQQRSTTAGPGPLPHGDTFKGTITASTGRLAGERGGVVVVLAHPPRGANPSTSLTLSFSGASCGVRPHCLRLTGRVSGQMTLQHSLPDVGHRFEISAGGTVGPLGQVHASGVAAGTGFIRTGRAAVALTLQSASGTVTVEAQSGPVPGRTDP